MLLCACERCTVHTRPRCETSFDFCEKKSARGAAERAFLRCVRPSALLTTAKSPSCRHGGTVDAAPGALVACAACRGGYCAHSAHVAPALPSDVDQVLCLLSRHPCGSRAHAIPRPGGCELVSCAARRAPRLRSCPGVQQAFARHSRFLADAASSSPAALEAALGAPLVRQSENRVYASAALSFSTCMVVRDLLRITLPSRVSLLTLARLPAPSSSWLSSSQRCSSRGPLRRRRRRSEGLLFGDACATTRCFSLAFVCAVWSSHATTRPLQAQLAVPTFVAPRGPGSPCAGLSFLGAICTFLRPVQAVAGALRRRTSASRRCGVRCCSGIERARPMMSGKETAVVTRRGAGAGASAADLMEVRTQGACICQICC